LQRWEISTHSSDFGEMLEAFLFHELHAHTNYNNLAPMWHWRSLQKDEVDFIFNNRVAIEVKAKKQISNKEVRGLKKLQEEKAQERYLLVCQSTVREKRDGIEVWPVNEFLKALWEGEFSAEKA
jgi:predicted AAA+ superfamily ATPase